MIVLPKNTYKRDLLHWVYSLNVDEKDREEYDLLQKVCTCYLHNGKHAFQIDRIEITDVEKHLIEERKYIHAENEEVRARFMDVSIRAGLYKREKLSLKRECSNLYLCIAELQHDSSAFVRSMAVSKKFRDRQRRSLERVAFFMATRNKSKNQMNRMALRAVRVSLKPGVQQTRGNDCRSSTD